MLRALVVASFLVLTCAACSGSTSTAGTEPSQTPDPTTSVATAPTSPSPTVPVYLERYSDPERAAYQDAVDAYGKFSDRDSQFAAVGQTTVEASDFYHRYAIDWRLNWANLAQLANNGVTVTGTAIVKWTRPVSVELDGKTRAVVIRQCLDQSEIVVSQEGKELAQPQFKKAHVFRARIEERPGETWWRSGIAQEGSIC